MSSQFKPRGRSEIALLIILSAVTFFAPSSFAISCDSVFSGEKPTARKVKSALDLYLKVQNLTASKKFNMEPQESETSIFNYTYGFSHGEILELEKGSHFPLSRLLLDEPIRSFAVSTDQNSLFLLKKSHDVFFIQTYQRHQVGFGSQVKPLNWWTAKDQLIRLNLRYGLPVKIIPYDQTSLFVLTDSGLMLKISLSESKILDVFSENSFEE